MMPDAIKGHASQTLSLEAVEDVEYSLLLDVLVRTNERPNMGVCTRGLNSNLRIVADERAVHSRGRVLQELHREGTGVIARAARFTAGS